jgi:2-polyprenyl-3-methyl-5-hydroxy-6-metoxy-1,4-benzoquinol methylase
LAETTTPIPEEIQQSDAPMVPTVDVATCEVCGRSETQPWAEGFDYELLTCRNRWHFVRCEACEHVWLSPRPEASALGVIYPSSYYAYNYGEISRIARWGKARMDARKLGLILRGADEPHRYLDVGCGDGRYLEVMRERGLPPGRIHGLELDAGVASELRSRGFDVHDERVEATERFRPGMFDLITIFHVIEHVESPAAVIERLASWLAPGGTLAVETPNIDSLDARLFRSGTWGGYHIPRHWHLFRTENLVRLLERAGLEVETTRYQTGHAFWMYSFHHALRYGRRPRPRIARRFDPFSSTVPLIGFTGFDVARGLLGARTSAVLAVARRPAAAEAGGNPADGE